MDLQELITKANEAKKRADDIQSAHYNVEAKTWATAEAATNWDAAMTDALAMKAKADEAVVQAERDAKVRDFTTWQSRSSGLLPGMSASAKAVEPFVQDGTSGIPSVQFKTASGEVKNFTPTGNRHFKAAQEAAYTDTFRRYLSGGLAALKPEDLELVEAKALSMGIDAAGGQLVAPEVVMSELIEALEDSVLMRRLGRVLPPLTTAASIRVNTAGDLDDAEWTTEVATATADTATPFGGRSLTPHPLAKLVKVSNTLLRLSGVDVESWTRGEGANRLSEAEESAFMTGSGTQRPLGVFTSTLPTTVTCTSSTDIAYADLVNTEFSLKSQYRQGASWIMHRTIIKELMLLVDGIGRPLLRDVPGAGVRFSLLGYDINESEYAPNSSATGLKVAALGNYKRAYWIVDSLNVTVQRLVELYAESNQTGFIFRKETDGMVVDGAGITLLQMA